MYLDVLLSKKKRKGSALKSTSRIVGYEIFTLMQTAIYLATVSQMIVEPACELLAQRQQHERQCEFHVFHLFFLVPQFHDRKCRGTQVVAACTVVLYHRWRTLCKAILRVAVTLSNLWSEGIWYLYNPGLETSQEETMSPTSKALYIYAAAAKLL